MFTLVGYDPIVVCLLLQALRGTDVPVFAPNADWPAAQSPSRNIFKLDRIDRWKETYTL